MKLYHEPAKDIPVWGTYDVIVAGGGTAGLFAALAAARTGARTLVVERLDCLGGLMTAGMMSACCGINDMEKIVVRGIPLEFFQALKERGGVIDAPMEREAFIFFDAEGAKETASSLIQAEPLLDVLYYTWVSGAIMDGNRIVGLIIENKSGRQAVYATCIVDATGDADVAVLAGAETVTIDKERAHPVSLLAKVGGVNKQAVLDYYAAHPQFLGTFTRNWPITPFHTYRIDRELQGRPLPSHLEYLRDWFILFYETIREGEFILNISGDIGVTGTNAADISRAQDISRRRISECIQVFRMYMPGCEDMYLISTGSTLGIRESRQIVGRYTITKEDLMNRRQFPDAIARACALVGNHTADGKDAAFADITPGSSFYMPYGCMLPKNIEGLLVAGRCISVEHEAMGGTRIMPVCMGLGQAAGTAAALAALDRVLPGDLDVSKVQSRLLQDGAFL